MARRGSAKPGGAGPGMARVLFKQLYLGKAGHRMAQLGVARRVKARPGAAM